MPALALDIDERRASLAAAESLAADLRARTAAGLDARGIPLDRPDDGGRPLHRTGRLLSQITAVSRGDTAEAGVHGDREKVARILAAPGGPAEHVFEATPRERDRAAAASKRVMRPRLTPKGPR